MREKIGMPEATTKGDLWEKYCDVALGDPR